MFRNISIGTRILSVLIILLLTIAALIMVINFTAKTVQEMGLETTKNIMHTGQQDKIKLGTQTMAAALAAALQSVV
jgi:methyl-accepting chemotaxis protein